MNNVTAFSDTDKRYTEECFGIDFEYFLLEEAIREDLASLDYLVVKLHRMRAAETVSSTCRITTGNTHQLVGRT